MQRQNFKTLMDFELTDLLKLSAYKNTHKCDCISKVMTKLRRSSKGLYSMGEKQLTVTESSYPLLKGGRWHKILI